MEQSPLPLATIAEHSTVAVLLEFGCGSKPHLLKRWLEGLGRSEPRSKDISCSEAQRGSRE